jgi:hypothetical protein
MNYPLAQSPSLSRRPETAASALPSPLNVNEIAFQLRPLVWDQIRKYIKPAEQDEVAFLIGRKSIEDNEVCKIYIEAVNIIRH